MSGWQARFSAKGTLLGLLVIVGMLGQDVLAQGGPPKVDPGAVQLLKTSMDFLGDQQKFSVQAKNFHEDMLDNGHRVDFESAASVTVQRPDRLRGERHGVDLQQVLFYDGASVSLYNPPEQVYATHAAPGTIEEMFTFVGDSLGLYVPITDLLRKNVFPLLIQDVDLAMVIDREFIDGVSCHHLLFSRPGVDFQIWIAELGQPVPLKYVVTDTGTPELLSIATTMTNWDFEPVVPENWFNFVVPPQAKQIPFLKVESWD